ncbi:hypothetical protein CEUSTIGMA_g5617.t1 [Chlamydomonas eustigma]|uniref:BHLH domain-containing protein n=1 Tax=Chlamydomonas eustigma TaxID=1157962 RepID=A0A250X517_9CHLO|nr:hypothetical protein CEUSTIGMA_g5617.t1 [Chlamydomonas eustigma]|eukprot:GAX78175.1 hypothetical protein CEUSTIGMA_g5617.t1 [Chlamydomonas eustigma]
MDFSDFSDIDIAQLIDADVFCLNPEEDIGSLSSSICVPNEPIVPVQRSGNLGNELQPTRESSSGHASKPPFATAVYNPSLIEQYLFPGVFINHVPQHPSGKGVTAEVLTKLGNSSKQEKAAEKTPVLSHSSTEKQRRDRLNSLIDELRELVPPSGEVQSDFAGGKRPKHTILADTIAYLKKIKDGAKSEPCSPTASENKTEHFSEAGDLAFGRSLSDTGCNDKPFDSNSQNSACQDDTIAPAQSSTGPEIKEKVKISNPLDAAVSVESSETGRLYLQVRCRNRRGLLADITAALSHVPVEILSGTVITQDDEMVYDVFELTPLKDASEHSYEALSNMVQKAVFQHLNGLECRTKRMKQQVEASPA